MDLAPGLELASDAVVLEGVNQGLIDFIAHAGMVHQLLFGRPLVITSGKDGQHTAGSLHGKGLAVDVRTRDLQPEEQALFLHVLSYAAPACTVAVFDERGVPGAGHIHLEWHGA